LIIQGHRLAEAGLSCQKKCLPDLFISRHFQDNGPPCIVPPVQDIKVFWFFSSEKNSLPYAFVSKWQSSK
jgi:hypothetical protein